METQKVSTLVEKVNKTISQPKFPKLDKLEFDLLMQHLRELYEELDNIRNESNQPEKKKRDNGESLQPEELLIRRTLHTNEHFLLNDIHLRQEEPELKKPEKHSTAKNEPQTLASPKASINESIKSPGSLNEKLKSSSGNEVHHVIASKRLKDMIDLNKKYVMVNVLFQGNKEHYNRAIIHLDDCADFSAAETFIRTQLSGAYKWDEHSQPVLLFMNLVKSKFGLE